MQVINAVGRRKTAVARIYLVEGNGAIIVNGKDYKAYFPTLPLQFIVNQSLQVTDLLGKFDISVNVMGGGIQDKQKLCV